ncbi:hypothetical protein F4679DRAFT_463036 [Xylaria curta]|nr:hypothetical protein F4679DRAFT_463036 [Xylaria curta]
MSPKTVHLKATYTSPTQPEGQLITSIPISLPTSQPEPTIASKTSYLTSLRAATITAQETVNAALTARMEEDIAARNADKDKGTAVGGEKSKGAVVDEVAEEENYGEEVAEDDDE